MKLFIDKSLTEQLLNWILDEGNRKLMPLGNNYTVEEIIEKDLLLTLILAEFEKHKGIFNDLIFKGGTLLSRNYLKYHRENWSTK